jgi:hypothetical protein
MLRMLCMLRTNLATFSYSRRRAQEKNGQQMSEVRSKAFALAREGCHGASAEWDRLV